MYGFLTPILIGQPDVLPSGHGRDSPMVGIVGIMCGLVLATLIGLGLYLVALLRQNHHILPEKRSQAGLI